MPEPPFIVSWFSVFFLKIFPQAETLVVQAPLKSNAYDAWLNIVMAAASPATFKPRGIFVSASKNIKIPYCLVMVFDPSQIK